MDQALVALGKIIFWIVVFRFIFSSKKEKNKVTNSTSKDRNCQPIKKKEEVVELPIKKVPTSSFSNKIQKESSSKKTTKTTKEIKIENAVKAISSQMEVLDFNLAPEQKKIFELLENTHQNIFIQGQAGTGKSTFVQYLKQHSKKRLTIVSPTAVAAINIGGVTIHSLFRLPFSDFFILEDLLKTTRKKLSSILHNTDILIIDEVSMVRPDMLDAIDFLSKTALRNKTAPFGGLQLLLIGDLCQLPPVIKSSAEHVFKEKYGYMDWKRILRACIQSAWSPAVIWRILCNIVVPFNIAPAGTSAFYLQPGEMSSPARKQFRLLFLDFLRQGGEVWRAVAGAFEDFAVRAVDRLAVRAQLGHVAGVRRVECRLDRQPERNRQPAGDIHDIRHFLADVFEYGAADFFAGRYLRGGGVQFGEQLVRLLDDQAPPESEQIRAERRIERQAHRLVERAHRVFILCHAVLPGMRCLR